MGVRNGFYFFWSGPFSQWAFYDIVVDGITYNTCEQYMMAKKASLFGDEEILQEIMAAKDPSMQKKLGKKVKGFIQEVWDEHNDEIVFEGNLAKFTQHLSLRQKLMDTGALTIVEASPLDNIWGIGLKEDDPRAIDPSKWKGLNKLGKAIERGREVIRLNPDKYPPVPHPLRK